MTFKEFWVKVKEFFKKIWWVIFVPIGAFIIARFVKKNSSDAEIKQEIKETKKEIKKEEKEIKKEEEHLQKQETEIKQEIKDCKQVLEEQKEEKQKQEAELAEILPGLKKKKK